MTLPALVDGPVATVWDERVASVRWARRALGGGTLLLAVQTTDLFLSAGAVCEVVVVDTSGRNPLDTLIDPRVSVTQSARKFHHLQDEMLAGAAASHRVLADLLAVTTGRTWRPTTRALSKPCFSGSAAKPGMDPEHLEDDQIWRSISQGPVRRDGSSQPSLAAAR